MLFHILWLISNLTPDNLMVKLFFFKNHIFDLFQIISDKYEFEEEINKILIKVINNNCRPTNFDGYEKEYIKIIPFLFKQINLFDEFKSINMCLYLLYKFSDTRNINILDSLLKNKVHLKIIEIYYDIKNCFYNDEEKIQLKLYILKIIGNITSGEDDNSYILMKDNIIKFIQFLLLDNDDLIVKHTLWIIRNLILSLPGNLSQFFQNNIINQIIDIGINIYDIFSNNFQGNENLLIAFKHLIYIIYFIINDHIDEYCFKILNYKSSICLMFLIFGLNLFQNDLTIIKMIFDCLHLIILFDEKHNLNFFNLMLSFNLESNLEILINCNDDLISEEAEFFHNKIING